MNTLYKTIIFLAAAAALVSCEYDLDTEKLESVGSRIYVASMPGLSDTTFIHVYRSFPVNHSGDVSTNINVRNITFRKDGNEVQLTKKDGNLWYYIDKENTSGRISLEVEADGLDKVEAESVIPPAPGIGLERKIVKYGNDQYIEHKFHLGGKNSFYGIDITRHGESYYDYEPEAFPYDYSLSPIDIGEDESLISELTENSRPYYMSFDKDHYKIIYLFTEDDIKDGCITYLTQYAEDRDYDYSQLSFPYGSSEPVVTTHHEKDIFTYDISVFSLSEECYRYMRAYFLKNDGGFASLGLSAPNFTYCNINNGYGYFCGVNCERFQLANL